MPTGIPLLRKKVSKNFLQKSIDKLKSLCYTKYVRLREGNRFALRKLKAMNRRYGARRAENRVNLNLTAEPDRVKDRCAIALKRTRHINDS